MGSYAVRSTTLPHERGVRRLLAHDGGGDADGVDDVLIAGAAAEISLQRVPDLLLGGVGVLREQIDRGEDHAGRAEAALQPVLLPERLLQRMQPVRRRAPRSS